METLYHFTKTYHAADIIKQNKFVLSMAEAAESDLAINKGKLFYLSLTRTRNNAFANKEHGVMFEMDGRALSSRFKLTQVDYWGDPKYSEAEERLVSDKPTIPASPFIVAVHINLGRNDDGKYLRELIIGCKRRKITVFVYDNIKDMLSMQKSRRLSLDDPRLQAKSKIIRGGYIPRARKDYVLPWLVLLHAVVQKKVPQVMKLKNADVDYVFDRVRRTYGDQRNLAEIASGLRSDIGNSRNFDRSDKRSRTPTALMMLAKQQGITIAGIPRFIYEAIKDL